MKPCRGEIWLVNLNPVRKSNEMGKIRPVLVFQSDLLNSNEYPSTIILPLSTSLVDDAAPVRMRIGKREKLEKESDIVLTQIRAIDNSRFIKKVASLTFDEMQMVKKLFDEIVS